VSFRVRLLAAFVLTAVLPTGLVAWAVSVTIRRAFERLDAQRTEALVAQFRREFERRRAEVAYRVEGMADTEATLRMALDLARPNPDYSLYVSDARGLAAAYRLDFVELVANDSTIVSSAHWPARFGYKNGWVSSRSDWKAQPAFLKREELPDGVALALMAVRVVSVGDKKLYIIGGQRLDQDFLASLVLPAGMRALLYRHLSPGFSPAGLLDASGPVARAGSLAPLIEQAHQQGREITQRVNWSSDPGDAETFHAIPLLDWQKDLLGVLLVGSSRRELVLLEDFIRRTALEVAGGGILLGLVFSWWIAARVTRPVEQLAAGARAVAAGNWSARVEIGSPESGARGEIGELARAFNSMTCQLAEQRERLVQAERVAAWRELARRLAHELKNPLFPLQITVENLRRAREQNPDEFDEVFSEGTATLLAELENLNNIVGSFSDFAKMPPPEFDRVNVNELVRDVLRLFEAQWDAAGRPPIRPELYLDEKVRPIQADPQQLRRALQNLILNAMDAMPSGGALTIRTTPHDGGVRLEMSDTGAGLTPEECERLFTPYYTTKRHGTGLGLAIVQSVVSDHGGRISVESETGRGTKFVLELPARPAGGPGRASPARAEGFGPARPGSPDSSSPS